MARRWAETDTVGELVVGDPTVELELVQDLAIDGIHGIGFYESWKAW